MTRPCPESTRALADLDALRAVFSGEILTADDGPRYDAARTVFNALHDRRPALIARATSASDVIGAIGFARERGLTLAVRGGGHSVAGFSTVEGGVVLDLGAMKGIAVDPAARRLRAQAGLTWGEIDRETQRFGLATTGGRVSSTGLVGFTLGSGSGWLERLHGWACDNLVAAEVVTADGRLVRASADEHADLLWGLKGGGGNFGVVTELELRLHPVGPQVLAGLLLHPIERAAAVMRFFRAWSAEQPRAVGGAVVMLTAPPAPFVPPALRARPAVAVVAIAFGALEAGLAALAELRAFGPPAADLVEPMPYLALQSMLDAANPPGRRNYWRSDNLAALPDEAIDVLAARAGAMTSPWSTLILQLCGGAIGDVPEGATPLGGRAAPWQYHCYGTWTEGDDAAHIAWVKDTERALAPWTSGRVSLNFVSEFGRDRVRAAFGDEVHRRLVALKRRYDPTNVFRLNQNIAPDAALER